MSNTESRIGNDVILESIKKASDAEEAKNNPTKPAKEAPIMTQETAIQKPATNSESFRRKIALVGIGDCGSNIAAVTKHDIPETYSLVYNTSGRSKPIGVDMLINVDGEDGSGRDREYSKNILKSGPVSNIIKNVATFAPAYTVVAASLDGGTAGCAPNYAVANGNNVSHTILAGVIPSLNSDQKAQFNTLQWLSDLQKVTAAKTDSGTPSVMGYMLFDNNVYSDLPDSEAYGLVNREVSNAVKVLEGGMYPESDGRSLDNRNLFKVLSHGKRINIYHSTAKLKLNETLDDYLLNLIKKACQPQPKNASAYAVFIKADKHTTDKINFSLDRLVETFGLAVEKYIHVDNSPGEFRVSLIISGSSNVVERFANAKQRYDDIQDAKGNEDDSEDIAGLLAVKDPFNQSNIKATVPVQERKGGSINLDGADF